MYYPVVSQCIHTLKLVETWLDKAEQLAATLSGMTDGVCMFDARMCLVEWNDRFPEVIGVPAQKKEGLATQVWPNTRRRGLLPECRTAFPFRPRPASSKMEQRGWTMVLRLIRNIAMA